MDVTEKFLEIMNEMPGYVRDYFVAKTNYLATTRLAYAMDLQGFFAYVISAFPDKFGCDRIKDISLSCFDALTPMDISYYLDYEKKFEEPDPHNPGKTITRENGAASLKRKLAAVRSFYKHFYKMGRLHGNPASLVDTPRVRDREIVILNENQQDKLLSHAENGDMKSDRAKKFHEKTVCRDIAIIRTLLGTGLRVSELAGLDMGDIDLDNQELLVLRKGGKRQIVPFNDEVKGALYDYIRTERGILTHEKDGYTKGAFFVSSRGTRITTRRIQQIVEQCSRDIMPENYHISPHVLRKTYGTQVYRDYDIYMAKEVLGHASISTTSKYYAKFDPKELEKLKHQEE